MLDNCCKNCYYGSNRSGTLEKRSPITGLPYYSLFSHTMCKKDGLTEKKHTDYCNGYKEKRN